MRNFYEDSRFCSIQSILGWISIKYTEERLKFAIDTLVKRKYYVSL